MEHRVCYGKRGRHLVCSLEREQEADYKCFLCINVAAVWLPQYVCMCVCVCAAIITRCCCCSCWPAPSNTVWPQIERPHSTGGGNKIKKKSGKKKQTVKYMLHTFEWSATHFATSKWYFVVVVVAAVVSCSLLAAIANCSFNCCFKCAFNLIFI